MATTEAMLLDTHVFLWASFAPEKLSKKARGWVMNAERELWVSVASLWEIEVKHRAGLLQADARVVEASLRAMGMKPLAIQAEHVRAAADMKVSGADVFDWVIAAQAMVEGLPVVTGDEGWEVWKGRVEVRW